MVHDLRLQSSWWGKAWPQKHEVKGHLASAPMQREEMNTQLTSPFLLFVSSAEPSLGTGPMFKDGLPSSLNSPGMLHRYTQRSLPLVILDIVKLTMKVSIV